MRQKQRKWAVIISLLIILVIVVGIGLKSYLATQLRLFLEAELGRQLDGEATVHNLSLNLTRPTIELDGIKLNSKKYNIVDLSVVTARVRFSTFPIFLGKVVISDIEVGDTRIEVNAPEPQQKKISRTPLQEIFKKRSWIEFIIEHAVMPKAYVVVNGADKQWQANLDLTQVESRRRNDRWFEFSINANGDVHRFVNQTKEKQYDINALKSIVVLDSGEVGLKSFSLSNNYGEFSANGKIYPDLDLKLSSNYELSGLPALLGDITPATATQPRFTGKVLFNGKAIGNYNNPKFNGEVSANQLHFGNSSIQQLHSNLRYENHKMQLTELLLELQEGNLTGNADWSTHSGLFQGALKLDRLNSQSFEAILKLFLPTAPTVQGDLTGTLSIDGTYLLKSGVEKVNLNTQLSAESLRMQGKAWESQLNNFTLKGKIAASQGLRVLNIEQFDVAANELTLTGSGRYAPQNYQLNMDGQVENVWQKLHPSLEKLFGKLQMHVALNGEQKRKAARLTLNSNNLRIGNQEGWNLDAIFEQENNLLTCPKLLLQHPSASLQASGSYQLDTAAFGNTAVQINNMPADFVIYFLPAKPGVRDDLARRTEGTLTGNLKMSGPYNSPQGEANIQMTKMHFFGETLDNIGLRSKFADGIYQVAELRMQKAAALLLAHGQINSNNNNIYLELKSQDVSSRDIRFLAAYIPKAHPLQIQGNLQGTLEAPQANLQLILFSDDQKELINTRMQGDFLLPNLRFTSQLNNRGQTTDNNRAELTLADETTLQVVLNNMNPLAFAMELGHRLPRETSANLSGNVNLKLGKNHKWDGNIDLTTLNLKQNNSDVLKNSTLQLWLNQSQLFLQECHLKGLSTDLRCTPPGNINGYANLSLLKTFLPFIPRAEGKANINLTTTKPITTFDFTGSVNVENATITFLGFPTLLENIRASAQLQHQRILVNGFNLTSGTGKGHGGGTMDVGEDWHSIHFDLYADAEQIPVRIPEDFPGVVSGKVKFTGPGSNALLEGDLRIDQLRYSKRFDWRSKLLDFGGRHRNELTNILVQNQSRKHYGVNFDIHLVAGEPVITIKNNVSDIDLTGDFTIRGKFPQVGLQGIFNVNRGKVNFRNHIFAIDSGNIEFTDPNKLIPFVDIYASARIQEYSVSLNIRTVNDQVQVDMSSTPALNETDLLALLTVGSAGTANIGGFGVNQNNNVTEQVAVGIMSGGLQDKVEKIGILDSFQVVPDYSQTNKSTELRLMLGKDITQDLGIIYSTDLYNAGNNQEMRLRQIINDNFSVSGNVKNASETNQNLDLGVDFEFGFDY